MLSSALGTESQVDLHHEALVQYAIKDTVPDLIVLLKHEKWETRTAAVRALLKLPKQRE